MAMDGGGYLRRRAEVISGTEVRRPSSSAAHMVEMAGEPNAAWRKATRWAMVACGVHGTAVYAVCSITCAACAYRRSCEGGGVGRLMRHNGEQWDLVPWRTVLPLSLMVMDVSSNVAMHP